MAPNMLWRLIARGPMDALRPAYDAAQALEFTPLLGSSLFEDGDPKTGRMDLLFAEQPDLDAFFERIGLETSGIETDFGPLPEEDWVRLSLEGLKPVEAGRFVVYGAHDKDVELKGKTGIEIEAGPAFGTGHHGTTRGCLIACGRLYEEGVEARRILDLGCGTGLLAIGAARLWPDAEILASDIDPDAVEETEINAEKNNVQTRIEAFAADGFQDARLDGAFDLIFANILAGPLQDLAGQLAERLAPRGVTILSGLLEEQIDAVSAAYETQGLSLRDSDIVEGWAILTFERAG